VAKEDLTFGCNARPAGLIEDVRRGALRESSAGGAVSEPDDEPWIRELQTHAHLRECEVGALVARGLEEIQVLHAERTRLRALVLDLLKAFDAPEQEQAAVKRRARDELAAR